MADQSSKTLDFLREVIAGAVRAGVFPAVPAIRKRFVEEPWVAQEILQSPWFGDVAGFLVPSIAGLQAAGTSEADRRLAATKQLFAEIRKLYLEDKIAVADHPLVAQAMGKTLPEVAHLLAHLVATGGLFTGYTHSNSSAPAREARLGERVLLEDPFAAPAPSSAVSVRGPISLRLRNFRGLRAVDWSPDGVCLIAGPNGSGKTTLLEALLFLSDLFQSNLPAAVRRQRGPVALRHLRAGASEGVSLRVQVGDASWELRLDVEGGSVGELPEETVRVGSSTKVRRQAFSVQWYHDRQPRGSDPQGRLCLRLAWDAQSSPDLKPLVDVLDGYRYHTGYALEALRQGGKGGDNDAHLTARGENLFVVLRNWKAAPRRFGDRFSWVLDKIKRAFPGVVEDIEFDPPVGEIVPARFFPPGERTGLPMARAADGFLVGLLHLTAVAGASEGAVVAIDEMENQLHPHAIRSILAAMRELADERNLTVLLTTHSPVLMNAFRDEPNRFFVTELSDRSQPVALDKLEDPEWLAHFSFGDLYDRLQIGAPPRAAE